MKRIEQMRDTTVKVFINPAFAEVHLHIRTYDGIVNVVMDSEASVLLCKAMEHVGGNASMWQRVKDAIKRLIR